MLAISAGEQNEQRHESWVEVFGRVVCSPLVLLRRSQVTLELRDDGAGGLACHERSVSPPQVAHDAPRRAACRERLASW